MGWIVRLNGKGRIVIPGEVREKLGLETGAIMSLEIKDNAIVLSKFQSKTSDNITKDSLRQFLTES